MDDSYFYYSYLDRDDLTYTNMHQEDKSIYYTSRYWYLDEMTKRVERHHKETVRNPEKIEFVKPYLNRVFGSYYTSNHELMAHYDPHSISNQEFIDRAYYEVVTRGYLRKRKRNKVNYRM